jgi:UDP-GlcNAc:undecaprenyl-phosphate GlcNAc-1-phosphate transferase
MTYFFYLIILFITELAYFKIADHYNIIDKPNHRSSHSEITIRGGGIIFPIAVLLWFAFSGFQYPYFICGLLLITTISFIDDLKDFSRSIRLLVHLIAMALVFWQLNLFSINWIYALIIFIFFIGVVNAYNFMDGINGITGIYSLATLATLLWINNYHVSFIDNSLLLSVILGIIVFSFFNFRKKAACFAGDVGSISIAFIICFLLIKLILQTSDIRYILLLSVYGIDTVFTLGLRLVKGENIFLAHRLHLYQLLVNDLKYQHLTVATLYGAIQLMINCSLIYTIKQNMYQVIIMFIIILAILYIILRIKTNHRQLYKTENV